MSGKFDGSLINNHQNTGSTDQQNIAIRETLNYISVFSHSFGNVPKQGKLGKICCFFENRELFSS